MAVNVAILARSEGETTAIHSASQIEDVVERNYYIDHIPQFKEAIVDDHTCQLIINNFSNFPPKSGDFYQLGIEFARMNFNKYLDNVTKSMCEKYGGLRTVENHDG